MTSRGAHRRISFYMIYAKHPLPTLPPPHSPPPWLAGRHCSACVSSLTRNLIHMCTFLTTTVWPYKRTTMTLALSGTSQHVIKTFREGCLAVLQKKEMQSSPLCRVNGTQMVHGAGLRWCSVWVGISDVWRIVFTRRRQEGGWAFTSSSLDINLKTLKKNFV